MAVRLENLSGVMKHEIHVVVVFNCVKQILKINTERTLYEEQK